MDGKVGMFDFAMILWDDGMLLFGAIGKGSIYLYKDEYYIINYNTHNHLESIEKIDELTAKRLIKEGSL